MPNDLGQFEPMEGMTPYTLGLLRAVQATAIVAAISSPKVKDAMLQLLEHYLTDVPDGITNDEAGAGSYRLPLRAMIKSLQDIG